MFDSLHVRVLRGECSPRANLCGVASLLAEYEWSLQGLSDEAVGSWLAVRVAE